MHSPQAIDGRNDDPVAIVGVSFRFPPDVVSEDEFWSLLESGRNVVSEMPSDRMNIDAFHGSNEVATDKVCLLETPVNAEKKKMLTSATVTSSRWSFSW